MKRGVLWSILIVITVAAVVALLFYRAVTRPDVWDEPLEGHWVLQHTQWPGGHSVFTELLYTDGSGRESVATAVHSWKAYGDDCLAYGAAGPAGERYFFVCGRKRPIPIAPDSQATWRFESTEVREQGFESTSTAFVSGSRVLRIADLKAAARKAPLR